MDALMPIDDQALQMLRELGQQITALQNNVTAQVSAVQNSFNATLRSLTETINKNAVTNEQRLTGLEKDLSGHVKLDDQVHARLDEVLREHARRVDEVGHDLEGMGRRFNRVEGLINQGKGLRYAWRAAVAIMGAIITALEWLRFRPKG